jgi:hypothetical protein
LKTKLRNLEKLAKDWARDAEKGKIGEKIVYTYLLKEGYQVLVIIPHNPSPELYSTDQKVKRASETIFAPDFLVLSEREQFFADSKWKSKSTFWVNVRDFDKYQAFMKRLDGQIEFRIYFTIDATKEIWVYNLDPQSEPSFETTMQPDGECYIIPWEDLRRVGRFD